MTSSKAARGRVAQVLTTAAEGFGVELEPWEDVGPRVDDVLAAQGIFGIPASVHEYLRLAGEPDHGLWKQFARCDGFSIRSMMSSRSRAIETALASAADWQMFRRLRPVVTLNWRSDGTVIWLPFDSDAADEDQDPEVWMLRESHQAVPEMIATTFSGYLEELVGEELAFRQDSTS